MAKGMSILSGVLFLAIIITATMLVYGMGMPIIQKMQAAASIEKMRTSMVKFDDVMRQVASEGKGSKRTVEFNLDEGELEVNDAANAVTWLFNTVAHVISPRTSQSWGNLKVGSNLDTTASETTYSGENAFLLENEHLKVYINRTGTAGSYANLSTSGLLLAINNKDTGEWLNNSGFLEVSVDDNETSLSGNGYTFLMTPGENLPYATVSALMNTSYLKYFINFTLESGTDFIEIEAST